MTVLVAGIDVMSGEIVVTGKDSASQVAFQGSRGPGDARSTIAAILARFPNGGTGLSDAISQAIEANPSLVDAVAAAAAAANPAQQQSIGIGLAQAAQFEANSGTAAGQAVQLQIQAVIPTAPAATVAAFYAGGGTILLLDIATGGAPNLTTSSCVSPSKPHGGC
jgi:hypothetical protein